MRRILFLHQATLDQIALPCPAEWEDWLDWMLQLPLWLDLGSCRVVHAAWDDAAVQACGTRDTLAEITLGKAGRRQTPEGGAVNWLLKGPEYKLGDGAVFVDKEGFTRKSVRAKWWIPIRPGMTHAEAAMPAGEIRGEGGVPDGVSFPGYGKRSQLYFSATTGWILRTSKLLWLQTSRVWITAPATAGRSSPIDSTAKQVLKPDKFVVVE